jgi:hypothetical protein
MEFHHLRQFQDATPTQLSNAVIDIGAGVIGDWGQNQGF